jgi:sugar phosphate permease
MKQVSSNPFFGVLLGADFTVAIQSSSGTMGIVIILASDGLIPLPAAVHLMLGAEVGICADTLLASIGRSVDAFRTAIFHLFNLITVSIGLVFAHQLAAAGQWLAFGRRQCGAANRGPNAISYLLAGEVFPTDVRGKGAGFAASFAKLGAVAAAFLFPIFLHTIGTSMLLFTLAGTSFLGAVFTWNFAIETKGLNPESLGSGAEPISPP